MASQSQLTAFLTAVSYTYDIKKDDLESMIIDIIAMIWILK